MNLHEFYIGKAFDAYEYFGAHLTKNGVLFRVYAPNAEKIEVIGEFNDWGRRPWTKCTTETSGSARCPGPKPE